MLQRIGGTRMLLGGTLDRSLKLKKKHVILIFFILTLPISVHLYAFQAFPYIAEYIVINDKGVQVFIDKHGFDGFNWHERIFTVHGKDDCIIEGVIAPFHFEMGYVMQLCGDERYEPRSRP